MQAGENCSCVTDQYSDPETVHDDTYFEITGSNPVKEVQGKLVDTALVVRSLQFFAYLYFS